MANASTPRARRGGRVFSLRSLFVVVTLVCLVLCAFSGAKNYERRFWKQKAIVDSFSQPGIAQYIYQLGTAFHVEHVDEHLTVAEIMNRRHHPIGDPPSPPGPKWMTRWFDSHMFAQVGRVDLKEPDHSDLERLRGLSALQQLNITKAYNLTNLDDLEGMSALQDLCIEGSFELASLKRFRKLKALRYVRLIDCLSLSNLNGLQDSRKLERLELETFRFRGERFSDISALAGLTNLQHLKIENSVITDLSVLSSLTGLSKLEIRTAKPCELDLSQLKGLTSLTELELSGIKLTNIAALKCFPLLKSVSLSWPKIHSDSGWYSQKKRQEYDPGKKPESLKGVRDLHQLEKLVLDMQLLDLNDLSDLAQLTNLKQLRLGSCQNLLDINDLASCSKLEHFALNSCPQVSSIEVLRETTALRSLSLADAAIENLRPLADLQELKSVLLVRCQKLIDIDSLRNLNNLESISIRACSGIQHVDASIFSMLGKLNRVEVLYCHGLNSIASTQNSISAGGPNELAPPESTYHLYVNDCSKLTQIGDLPNAGSAMVRSCNRLTDLVNLRNNLTLESLSLWESAAIQKIHSLASIPALKKLSIYRCKKIEAGDVELLRMQRPKIEISFN